MHCCWTFCSWLLILHSGYTKEEDTEYWHRTAEAVLKEKLDHREQRGVAKNLILFMGDGMSVATLTAARIYQGQKEHKDGVSNRLSFETFPSAGLTKAYCLDTLVAESACAANAFLSGVRTKHNTLGVAGSVKRLDCAAMMERRLQTDSILQWAQDAGKATGVVTTTAITDASPAAAYAHSANRYWQSDADVVRDGLKPEECPDIAHQLVYGLPGRAVKVLLGGGRDKLLHRSSPVAGARGERLDEDLVQAWLERRQRGGANAIYVWDRRQLLAIDPGRTEYLLGLFHPQHMEYHLDANNVTQPTLKEMTVSAISMLSKEKRGYFLFVESGLIDIAHHQNQAHRALDETVQLSEAVQAATAMTREEETLIVVTSDHAHTMTISGYSDRDADILTATGRSNVDNRTYAILSYANGPSAVDAYVNGSRRNATAGDMRNSSYRYPAMVPLRKETHGGEDVVVYARGPWCHLFSGSYEQTAIPHMMAYAARIGPSLHVASGVLPLHTCSCCALIAISLLQLVFFYFCNV